MSRVRGKQRSFDPGAAARHLGGQGEGSKRRRRIGVHGGPVEGQREEGRKTTLTQYERIMQILIAHDHSHPAASFPSFLV